MHTQLRVSERQDASHGIHLAPMLGFVIIVVADSRARMGALIAVVDEVHLGGVYDITFSTTE